MGREGVQMFVFFWNLRYLPNTGICNACSTSELLILYVDYVIGFSALCSFFWAFYRTFVPFCGKLLMDWLLCWEMSKSSLLQVHGVTVQCRNSAVCSPAWRIGDNFFFLPKVYLIFISSLLCRWLHNEADYPEKLQSPSLEILMNSLGSNPVHCALGSSCLNREVGPEVFSKLTHSLNNINHAEFLFLSLQPLSHQQGERNRVLSNSWLSTTCCILLPQFSLPTVGFGMELGCFGWFEFFEGGGVCVYVCVSLHRKLVLADFFSGVKDPAIVLNALEGTIRRVNTGREMTEIKLFLWFFVFFGP